MCALLIAIGTFTKSWVGADERRMSVGVGLTGAKLCSEGQCISMGWGDKMMKRAPGDIKLFGYLGLIAGLGAIGAAGAAGGLALSRNTHKVPLKPLYGAIGAASFTHSYFLVRLLVDEKIGKGASIGYSGIVSIIGLIGAGFVLKQMLGPIIKQGAPAGAAP
ncbi:MAG: hypothetical protein KC464_18990, partial [Myxococcales bacterium]|nr:hypothetical protein [Myxococcales bacterium]